jgi:hypothetical protein
MGTGSEGKWKGKDLEGRVNGKEGKWKGKELEGRGNGRDRNLKGKGTERDGDLKGGELEWRGTVCQGCYGINETTRMTFTVQHTTQSFVLPCVLKCTVEAFYYDHFVSRPFR